MANLENSINFTSLGMLILDEVHLPSGKVIENVIGGSGSYGTSSHLRLCHPIHTAKIMITIAASLGARLFSPKNLSTQVGWTIRKGYDFPPESLTQLETWGLSLSVIQEDTCLSTRGQLKYLDSSFSSNPSAFTRLESLGSDRRNVIQPNPLNTSLQP